MKRSAWILIVLFVPLTAILVGIAAGSSGESAGTLRDSAAGELHRLRGALREGVTRGADLAEQVWGSLRRILAAMFGFGPGPAPDPAGGGRGASGGASGSGAAATGSRPPVHAAEALSAPGVGEEDGGELADSGRQAALRTAVTTALRVRHRLKSAEELRVEALIDTVYQEYFRTYTIAGNPVTIRMPFGLNGEREGSRGFIQTFQLGAKGSPEELWKQVDSVVASRAFSGYLEALAAPGEKVLILDLERKSYSVSREPELIRSLSAGSYPGTPTRVLVYRPGGTQLEADIYNYLYALGSIGVDCSGLVHYVHQTIAKAFGADLERELAASWRTRPALVRYRIGLWFYDPLSKHTEPVEDRIEDLRPADLLLFEGSDGSFKHSAVIQSIDFEKGLIRYIQSTDWAPQAERGVHESLIRFDPARPEVDLRHYSVRWLQQVRPPFQGETEPRDWRDDGDRYLWYLDAGGSRVVRLKALAKVLSRSEPRFYTNVYRDEASAGEEDRP